MDKPSFQISDGSIKADESICEKTNNDSLKPSNSQTEIKPTLKELEPLAKEPSNNTKSISPSKSIINKDIHHASNHNKQNPEQFVAKVKSNLLSTLEATNKTPQPIPSENSLPLTSKIVQNPQQQLPSVLSEFSFSSAASVPLKPKEVPRKWKIPKLFEGDTMSASDL